MNIPEIGSIISGTFWSEPVRIIAAKVIGDFIELTVEGVESKNISKCTLDESQWQSLAITPPESQFTYQADPVKFRLAVEALLIRLAHEFDPHVAVSVCQIDPLPHQLEAVYGYLLPQPRIRFLLADDPGSGKTIMAGLLLKELKLRGLVTRGRARNQVKPSGVWLRRFLIFCLWIQKRSRCMTVCWVQQTAVHCN